MLLLFERKFILSAKFADSFDQQKLAYVFLAIVNKQIDTNLMWLIDVRVELFYLLESDKSFRWKKVAKASVKPLDSIRIGLF